MAPKKTIETSPDKRRQSIEADVAAYLDAGNKVEEVPSGITSHDPKGRGRQLRLSSAKEQGNVSNKGAAKSQQERSD